MESFEKLIPGKVVWTQMTHACTFLSSLLSALFKVSILEVSSSCGHSMSTSSSIGVPKSVFFSKPQLDVEGISTKEIKNVGQPLLGVCPGMDCSSICHDGRMGCMPKWL